MKQNETPAEPTVLHLADLRFGADPKLATGEALLAELRKLRDDDDLRPDLVVVTGDLADSGRKSEYEDARRFLEKLCRSLDLTPARVVTVPGNHDVNRALCEAYFNRCEGEEMTPLPPYWPKWAPWAEFFDAFHRPASGVTFTEDRPWSLFVVEDLGLVVAGLNSTVAESHRDEDHYGLLGTEQLDWFREQLEPYRDRGWLRIAALHHDVDAELRDAEALHAVLGPYLNAVLHGAGSSGGLRPRRGQTPILVAGSPRGIAGRYQVVALADRHATLEPTPARPRSARRPMVATAAEDELFSQVEQICRLREGDGAMIDRMPGRPPASGYLRVSVREGDVARLYAVGISPHGVDDQTLDAFLHVHHRYRRTDFGAVSFFVYGGDPASERLLRRAASHGVRVQSFVEYQGLIDFRAYLGRQTRRLEADRVYPPGLYVPQRLASPTATADALETVSGWLAEPHGGFFVVLGDSGTGKTFLLHELARRMGRDPGPLTPILVEMHGLEKARSVNQLIAQQLTRTGMDRFDVKAFRYMLEQGRIALLFDGFDELAVRVTYPRAVDHFATLVEAARGEARVVVSCRAQHFEADRQLADWMERLPGYRQALLAPFDTTQIRHFLVNRLGDETRAGARFDLLGRVGDLLGLARNPRLLGFIADLEVADLEAVGKRGEVTAASLYERLLGRWLKYEDRRQHPTPATLALSVDERWEAITRLALRLWRKTEPTLDLGELTEEVVRTLEGLSEIRMGEGVAAHQLGSGTVLVRDAEGRFSFIHESVCEWLVARRAAQELCQSGDSDLLAIRRLSPLMAEFLRDLAGRQPTVAWTVRALTTAVNEIALDNAELLRDQLAEAGPVEGAEQDLRDRDFCLRDLSDADLRGADLRSVRLVGARLRNARLSGARLAGADLRRADLRGADLSRADLSDARLLGADLRQARLEGTVLRCAALLAARIDDDGLRDAVVDGALGPGGTVEPWFAGQEAVRSVAFSPDGRTMASGSDGGAVRLWDVETGRQRGRLEGHDDPVVALSFSTDGRLLASTSGGGVRVWEVETGRLQDRSAADSDFEETAASSSDGRWQAAPGPADSLTLRDLATEGEKHSLAGHQGPVTAVAFGPDGRLLASASADGTIRIWDLASRRTRLTYLPLAAGWVSFTPDGRYKLGGETAGAFGHAAGSRRFEPGELDAFCPTPLRRPDDEPLLRIDAEAIRARRSRPWTEDKAEGVLPLPLTVTEWKRPDRSGDFFFTAALPGDAVLVAAVDVAGHGPAAHANALVLQGWLRGWLRGLGGPPRLANLAEDLSRELRASAIGVSCYLALLSPRPELRHAVSYEAVSWAFPPPLLITGPPFRTLHSAHVGPALPGEDLLARPVRIESLPAPWRLVVATDGLLRRLGNGDEYRGVRVLRQWQTGTDRDCCPTRRLKTTDLAVDDELFAVLRWQRWDLETFFDAMDGAAQADAFDRVVRRIRAATGERRTRDMERAMVEAINNATTHGYGNGPGRITLRFRDEDGRCRVEIEDRGTGEVTESMTDGARSGFAVMRDSADHVDVRRGGERGTIVTLVVDKDAGSDAIH